MQTFSPDGRRLMIVDDDELSREVLALLAEEAGFTVESFESGESALAHLAKRPAAIPSVVLVDMQMPGISGDSLAVLLRGACAPEAVLVAMSGSVVPESLIRHFDRFLLKPFSMEDLCDVLASAGDAAPTKAEPPELAPALSHATYQVLAESMPAPKLAELYAMCIGDAERRLTAMRQASEVRDVNAYGRAAHAIKGSCGMVGALELAALAADMEKQGLPAVDDLVPFDQFLAASARLRRILDAQER